MPAPLFPYAGLTGPDLARLRRRARLSARQVAEAMNVSRSRIASIESIARPTQDISIRYLSAVEAADAEARNAAG